jgi:dTDP-D-glucose 4,6-dehydratase
MIIFNFTMMKILVTGGAGFIGSNLCENLNFNPEDKLYKYIMFL